MGMLSALQSFSCFGSKRSELRQGPDQDSPKAVMRHDYSALHQPHVAGRSSSRYVASIDFGTTFSGFAYGKVGDNSQGIAVRTNWEGAPTSTGSSKTVTSLLYEKTDSGINNLTTWGWPARTAFQSRTPTNSLTSTSSRSSHGVAAAPLGRLTCVERFKLHLQENVPPGLDPLPDNLAVEECISDYLRKMSDECFKDILKDSGNLARREEVQWCLTVPAMWHSDRAKQKIKKIAASLVAGAAAQSRDPVLIMLEPEAASYYCQDQMDKDLEGQEGVHLAGGECYLVVDAGGGTVDIAYHRTEKKTRRLLEVVGGRGDLCGASFIDQNFKELYLQQQPWFQDLTEDEQTYFGQKITQEFALVKAGFKSGIDVGSMKLRLPDDVPDAVRRSVGKNIIELTSNDMKSFFEPVVKRVLGLIKDRLDNAPRPCDRIFLVGGFAESAYLQWRVREAFGQRMGGTKNIGCPQQPADAVLRGAVLYGMNPVRFTSEIRVSRKTYGIRWYRPWPADWKPPSEVEREQAEIYREGKGKSKDLAFDHFETFIKVGDEVTLDQPKHHILKMVELAKGPLEFEVWSSSKKNVESTIEEGAVQEATVPLDELLAGGTEYKKIEVTMSFGATAIEVTWKPIGKNTTNALPGVKRLIQFETGQYE